MEQGSGWTEEPEVTDAAASDSDANVERFAVGFSVRVIRAQDATAAVESFRPSCM